MRALIHSRDLRTLFNGGAAVAAAGLMLGLAMQPNLDARAVEGPQILAAGGGPRGAEVSTDPGLPAYQGRVPDYVIGTDWTHPPPAEHPVEAPAAQSYTDDAAAREAEPPAPVRRAAWREVPREPAVYPSVMGDTAYDGELPAPPAAPEDNDQG